MSSAEKECEKWIAERQRVQSIHTIPIRTAFHAGYAAAVIRETTMPTAPEETLVERLRVHAADQRYSNQPTALLTEAADYVERLEAVVEAARALADVDGEAEETTLRAALEALDTRQETVPKGTKEPKNQRSPLSDG